MDALYKVYERDAFTFVMAASMTGGIMSIITLVFGVLMSRIQIFYYFSTLIKNVLVFQPEQKHNVLS